MWKAALTEIRACGHQGAKLLRRDDQRNVNHRYILILTRPSGSNFQRHIRVRLGGRCRREMKYLGMMG
jgi:hypothetical protein